MKKNTVIFLVVAALIAALLYFLVFRKMNTLQRPVKGRVTSKFGNRVHPITKKVTFHNGVDYADPTGTPVQCPLDGVAIMVDHVDDTAGGIQLIIEHANKWRTGYGHLSRFNNIKLGDKVKQGQVIAFVGNSGASTGAHLHFTLTDPKGNKVDPELYINKALV